MKKKLEKNLENFFLVYNTPRPPICVPKNSSPIGSAVWSALGNIYTNVVLLYRLSKGEKKIGKNVEFFLAYNTSRPLMSVYTNVLFYYIE